MLSYQHIYHAGCAADVHKHAALALLLEDAVKNKDKISYIETHAGRGKYDLRAPEALKTGEAKSGVMRLAGRTLPDAMTPYLRAITAKKGEYPGSPLIAARFLRPQDDITLCELHPREHDALAENFKNDRRARILKVDGYEAVSSLNPDGRIILFIDPSFEMKDEYERAARWFCDMKLRWPAAILMFWVQLLAAGRHVDARAVLEKAGAWIQEAVFASPGSVRGMYGSLLAGINIPETVKQGMSGIGTWVSENCRPESVNLKD